MTAHQLKLNPSKTELLIIPGDPSPAQDIAIFLNNSMISPSATARNLGFLTSASSFRGVACAAGLLTLTSTGYWAYRRLKRRSGLPAADPQPAQGAVADVEEVEHVQVTEPTYQLPPTELHPQTSAVVLCSRHGARRNIWFLTSHIYGSQFQTVEVQRYFIQPRWFTVTETVRVPLGASHTDVALNLPAIREAFSRMLACIHVQNLLYVSGKLMLMYLAAANKMDVVRVQLAYDTVIRFLREPSNWESFEAELLQARNMLTVLLEDLFYQDLELYGDPAALASAVLSIVKQHEQEMMKTIQRIPQHTFRDLVI
ncbi:hypothetical protein QTP86_006327 [Hemibagrus guttatus]|nr:hypothetical protein QTP86_006327 [Hemibagrus guttatus]